MVTGTGMRTSLSRARAPDPSESAHAYDYDHEDMYIAPRDRSRSRSARARALAARLAPPSDKRAGVRRHISMSGDIDVHDQLGTGPDHDASTRAYAYGDDDVYSARDRVHMHVYALGSGSVRLRSSSSSGTSTRDLERADRYDAGPLRTHTHTRTVRVADPSSSIGDDIDRDVAMHMATEFEDS